MYQEVKGTVIAAKRQWWLKVNTKPVRKHAMDGAIFPYIIQVQYTVSGKNYFKRKWIPAGKYVPAVGTTITVCYDENKPSKAKIF